MREIPLYDAKNGLSALIAAVEETGETFVITRHGRPAAHLSPANRGPSQAERAAAIKDLASLREEVARTCADAPSMSWEELKALMRDEEA